LTEGAAKSMVATLAGGGLAAAGTCPRAPPQARAQGEGALGWAPAVLRWQQFVRRRLRRGRGSP